MTFDQYEKQFRVKANRAGFSEEDVQKCLEYAKPIIDNGFPVIYNTSNLSALVGYRKNYIKRAVFFTPYFYRKFFIKKANGNYRELKEPLPSLKEIQLWILNNILYKVPPSKFSKAYIPKRGIIDNVRFHKKKEKILSLDIKDFFPSIKRSSVESIFSDMGYSSNVANLLSKLCCCDEQLPQGAPTSPCISNIYLTNLDNQIGNYCKNIEVRYTRYADDMFFSGDFNEEPVIEFVASALEVLDLKLNKDKVQVMLPNMRQKVTGIVVNEKAQIPKYQRRQIRQEVHYLTKFGLSDHLNHTNNKRANYLVHLLGKINYALTINPVDTELKEYREYVSSLVKEEESGFMKN